MGVTLLAQELTAEQAADWGLIWQCVEDSELAASVDAIAATLVAAPSLALTRAKQAIYASSSNTLEQQLNLERDTLRELGRTADYREAVATFMAKRK